MNAEHLKELGIIQGDEMVLNMGPQHPSTHGVLRLKIVTDGEIVSSVEPIIGYLHRCFEKHCEYLTYSQILPFTDRCDYLASMHMTHSFSMAVEKLLDIEIPERVEYIRVIEDILIKGTGSNKKREILNTSGSFEFMIRNLKEQFYD